MRNQFAEVQNTFEDFDIRINTMEQKLQAAINQMQNTRGELYNVSQVMKITGLSRHIIERDIDSERLRTTSRGGRTLIRQDELNEYIKS